MQNPMARQGGYPQQNPADVGGCGSGYGTAQGACGPTGYLTGPGPYTSLAPPGRIYAIYFQLGFCGAVDHNGVFYTVSVYIDDQGQPRRLYTAIDTQLAFEIGQGYFQICGVNVTAGEDVCASVFQNNSNLPNIAGDVDLSIWSTDGCWCPFEECISAANDSSLILEAKVVPSKDMETTQITTEVDGQGVPTEQSFVFLSDLRLAFVGTLFRTVEGCQTVGVFAPLEQCAQEPAQCGPGGAGGYALGAGDMRAMPNPAMARSHGY